MASTADLDRIGREYQEQGYSVMEGLFSPEECRAVQDVAEKLSSFTGGTLLPVMNLHHERPELLQTMSDERLVSIIRHPIKSELVGLQTQYFFCRPGGINVGRIKQIHARIKA